MGQRATRPRHLTIYKGDGRRVSKYGTLEPSITGHEPARV